MINEMVEDLRIMLRKHDYDYYILNSRVISDNIYDKMLGGVYESI